ncbi:MAG: FkbM family methyltransferase [Dehalococcoidia bacterium]|jgi:FkbM family methyltransferase|nr:FkbM family methyltransferase [Dehalococcoidia bacterium]MDW8008856.1 FkbM family methyltransferase [Chloroflexota bacterium]
MRRQALLAHWQRSLLDSLRRWRAVHRLGFPPERLAQVRTRDGQSLLVPGECVENGLYYAEVWEPYTVSLFLEELRPGHTVVDVGAHVGYYTLMAARAVGPRGTVYALEPAPAEARLLLWNVARNGHANVRVVPRAAGDRRGRVTLSLSGISSMHSLGRHDEAGPWRGSVRVPMVTVDGLLRGRPVDVVKMDVEGAEPLVLKGMLRTVRASPGLVIFSEFSPHVYGALSLDAEEFVAQLMDLGFQVWLVDEWERRLVPVPRGRAVEIYYSLVMRGHLVCRRAG